MSADRARAAGRVRDFLRAELGSRRVEVEADGPEGEIAVVRVPLPLAPALLEPDRRDRTVERAREEGFRYAALELG